MNTLKFGNGEWYGKKDTILAYNDENSNFKPLPFSFDRASFATRVNKDGLIETVGSGEPRIDYKDDSNGALLLEPTRSNNITYSEDFTATNWDNVGNPVTITSNSIISPNGSLNGTLITPSSGNSRHAIRNLSASAVSGTTYLLSVFVKKGGSRYIVFGDAGDSLWRLITVDLDNGTITNETNAIGTITPYGNGWYRITCSFTRTNAGIVQFSLGTSETDSNSDLPFFDNTSLTVYAYGCQIESNSSYATSYIPTQGAIRTRVAEVCNQTPPSGIIGQTEGTLFFEFEDLNYSAASIARGLSISDGTYSNRIYISQLSSGAIYIISSTGCEIQEATPSGRRDNLKVALGYKNNDYVLYVNGVLSGTDAVSVPICNKIYLGQEIGLDVNCLYKPYKEVKLYNTRLSNTELQALTSN
jgi:hypothetical protein